jgi:tetratricopeptide (TPR) repeat protein
LRQKKYTNAIETLTVILKYDENNAKVQYLRGKALLILKNYNHALTDLCKAKSLSKGVYPEIDNLIAEVKKQIKN